MADVEIGIGKSGRRAYGFDDIAIVPSRRTRDPEEVDIGWEIDAFRFELPVMASPSDSVVSPATAAELGRLGGLGVLHLEGLWTRYADPEPVLEEIAGARRPRRPPAGCRSSTPSRCSPTSSGSASASSRPSGHTVAVACTPQRTLEHGARTCCAPSPTCS